MNEQEREILDACRTPRTIEQVTQIMNDRFRRDAIATAGEIERAIGDLIDDGKLVKSDGRYVGTPLGLLSQDSRRTRAS